MVLRLSTRSYANSTEEAGSFGPSEAQKTEVHRFGLAQDSATAAPATRSSDSTEYIGVQGSSTEIAADQTSAHSAPQPAVPSAQQPTAPRFDLGTPPPPPASSLPPSVAPRAQRSRPTDDTELVSVSANTADSAADTGEDDRP